jgi:acetate kinase
MNILTLVVGQETLRYACFTNARRKPFFAGEARDLRGCAADATAAAAALAEVRRRCIRAGALPDVIGIRVAYGGTQFEGPAIADEATTRRLEGLTVLAPLHIPAAAAAARACIGAFPGTLAVLLFETSFFAALAQREYGYAVNAGEARRLGLRRFGYHGLFHEAATALGERLGREEKAAAPARVISICLEPRPEIASAVGGRALTVTGGATPLEGIPGETTSGEIDPSIVLEIAAKTHLGPEQIDAILTRESGIKGLAGKRATLDEAFAAEGGALRRAASVIEYRMLLSCGAAIAAMGGIDRIIFSGRYAQSGRIIGPRLARKIAKCCRGARVNWGILDDTLERIIADKALATQLERARKIAG